MPSDCLNSEVEVIRNNKGMTLLEIMIVLVILGSLVTILATQVTKQLDKAKVLKFKFPKWVKLWICITRIAEATLLA